MNEYSSLKLNEKIDVLSQPKRKDQEGPIALIFAPTHELIEQIHTELLKFTQYLQLKTTAVIGGLSITEQIGSLKSKPDIIVCNPGRMIDLLTNNNGTIVNLKRISFVVLDEADRLLDSGFGPQITKILNAIRPDRQTVLFSATFPQVVEKHAKELLQKPIIEIIFGGRTRVSDKIDEQIEVIKEEMKPTRLLELLEDQRGKILIFGERQDRCDKIYQFLQNENKKCLLIHGGFDQIDRQNTIDQFKDEIENHILISTSVCARGLDVKNLNLVINYDCPNHMEDYIHRVGRTGRAGNSGKAITFITEEEEKYSEDIVKILTLSGKEIPKKLSELYDSWKLKKAFISKSTKKKGYKGSGYQFNEMEEVKSYERKVEGFIGSNEKKEMKKMSKDEDNEEQYELQMRLKDKQMKEELTKKNIPIEKQSMVKKALREIQKINSRMTTTTIRGFGLTLEINDFSRKCRAELTRKDKLQMIMHNCNVFISTKGTFIPEGSKVLPGQTKLYLLIEGKNEEDINKAKNEIKELLNEVLNRTKESIRTEQLQFTSI